MTKYRISQNAAGEFLVEYQVTKGFWAYVEGFRKVRYTTLEDACRRKAELIVKDELERKRNISWVVI